MATEKVITAKVPANEEAGTAEMEGSVTVSFPETLEEAEQMYGADAVLSNAFANWRVTLQSNIRSGLKRGESIEAIQARLAGAKMGVATAGGKTDPVDAFMAMYQSSTPEKQAELLEKLKERAAR